VRPKLRRTLWGIVVGSLVIQAVPYGHDHANPPVKREPPWDSPSTRALAARACFDCHSNETAWPWYASVAPASWLVQRDVSEGRRELNFSEWDRTRGAKKAQDAVELVREGEMPPWFYPWARLTREERAQLVRGFSAISGGVGRRASLASE
jgi:hypothetical protein